MHTPLQTHTDEDTCPQTHTHKGGTPTNLHTYINLLTYIHTYTHTHTHYRAQIGLYPHRSRTDSTHQEETPPLLQLRRIMWTDRKPLGTVNQVWPNLYLGNE